MTKKKVTAPLTYNPGRGRPNEHLAYLNRQEMQALMRLNGGNQERGPRNLPSFPPADATSGSYNSGYGSGGSKPSSGGPRSGMSGSVSPSSGSPRGSNPSSNFGGGGNKGNTTNVNRSGPGSTGGYKTPEGQAQAAYNKSDAYASTYGKNAGMSFTPMVMRGTGSSLVSGGPGAPAVLVSPGYESYYADRKGNLAPVGNVLGNQFQDNPVAMTGIKTLSGAGPVDYYRAAQSVQFRPIPESELGYSAYGYMDPQYSYSPIGGIASWDPKVVVDPSADKSANYALGGFSTPIMSNTGLGYGSPMERGHFQTLSHELQHVGQHSHLLSPQNGPVGGLTQRPVMDARVAYDPSRIGMTNYGGIENLNREIDYLDARVKLGKDPRYQATSDVATGEYLGRVPNYSGSLAAGLSANAAREMVKESQRLNALGLNTEADRYTRQTQKLQGGNSPKYGKSNMADYVSTDFDIRAASEFKPSQPSTGSSTRSKSSTKGSIGRPAGNKSSPGKRYSGPPKGIGF